MKLLTFELVLIVSIYRQCSYIRVYYVVTITVCTLHAANKIYRKEVKGKAWTGLIWLRRGTGNGRFGMQ